MDLARDEPRRALQEGRSILDEISKDDQATSSIVFRAMAIAARMAGSLAESVRFGQLSVVHAESSEESSLRSEALMTLSGSLALMGDNEKALQILDEAYTGSTGLLRATIASQEGAIRHRLGESLAAMRCYEDALPAFRSTGQWSSVGLVLNNMAMLRTGMGDFRGAERDLAEAREIYERLNQKYEISGVIHNQGLVAAYRGDLPEALMLFDAGEALLADVVGSPAETQVSRVDVLVSAGLFREAISLVGAILDYTQGAGLGEDEAEARLAGAQAALFSGDSELARRWSEEAADQFASQDRPVWAANARHVGILARYQLGESSRSLLRDARQTAEILEAERQLIPASNTRLIAGLIGLDLGLTEEATHDLSLVSHHGFRHLEVRLQSWRATALIRLATEDPNGADAAARAGMRLLDRYQAALGATDIRNGVERHGAELGALGLRLALESRKPRRVLAWMERSRARALRHPPVIPADDAGQAADLAELRRVSVELRSAEGDGAERLTRQASSLQESIRARSRTQRGSGHSGQAAPDIIGALGAKTLIEYASLDDRLWAVTVRNSRHRLHELGPEGPVLAELESLRFTMRRLARGRGSANADLAHEIAGRLDALLFSGMRLGDGPLVIVPTPALHATPWAALPSCEGRPITIAPSAELWWRAGRMRRRRGPVLVAAGPHLDHADAEMQEVGSLYPSSSMLGPDESTVEGIRQLFEPASVAHIACHASFQVENPMFSALRLADGDLTVYDMERMRRVPQLVVLSACDSGFSEALPGEELMGLSAALLSMGTRSIVASVGLVPDSDATRSLMIDFHRHSISGRPPAEALSLAQTANRGTPEGLVAAASFVCVGAG